MEATVEKGRKVSVRVPKLPNGKDGDYVTVQINGKVTQIMRGVTVEVSPLVAKLLEEAGYLDA